MTHNEFDLEQFADLFDQAMTSDNPTVKRAFKNLLLVAAIVESDERKVVGPMREILEELKELRRRVNSLEGQFVRPQAPTPFNPGTPYGPVPLGPYTIPNTGTPYNPGTGIWYTNGTGNIPVGGQGASSTAFDDQFTPEPILPAHKFQDFMDKFK
jgi:hypothetical protein